jgi:hypothetical protein
MAAFEYVSLKCVNQWCGAKFIRPLTRRKATQACPVCGRAAGMASDRVNQRPRVPAEPGVGIED